MTGGSSVLTASVLASYLRDSIDARYSTSVNLTSSDGSEEMPATTSQRRAP